MTFWIRTEKGETIKLYDSAWRNRIYAHGPEADSPDFLQSRLAKTSASHFVSSVKFAYKKADLLQQGVQKVLEIELSQADKARQVAEALESIFQNPLTFKLYNIDVLPEQTYFYEKDILPLGFVQVETVDDQITRWELQDDVESVDYTVPDLRVTSIDIAISSKVPRFDSRLRDNSPRFQRFDEIRRTKRSRDNRKCTE